MITLAAAGISLTIALAQPRSCREVAAKAYELTRLHDSGAKLEGFTHKWDNILLGYIYSIQPTPEHAAEWAYALCVEMSGEERST